MRTLEQENQILKTELAAERFMIDQITKLNSSEIITDGIQEMLGALERMFMQTVLTSLKLPIIISPPTPTNGALPVSFRRLII